MSLLESQSESNRAPGGIEIMFLARQLVSLIAAAALVLSGQTVANAATPQPDIESSYETSTSPTPESSQPALSESAAPSSAQSEPPASSRSIGGSIAGTVVANSPASTPLAGVSVEACPRWSSGACTSVLTNASGEYQLSGLSAGYSYWLRFVAPDTSTYISTYYGSRNVWESNAVEIFEGVDLTGHDVRLDVGQTLSGRVIASNGSPIALAFVEVSGAVFETRKTDADGNYRFAALPLGDYKVKFTSGESNGNFATEYFDNKATHSSAALVSLSAAAPQVANAVLDVSATLSGVVRDSNSSPISEGVSVKAIQSNAAAFNEYSYVVGETQVGENGQWQITGLPAGTYRVKFEPGYSSRYLAEYFGGSSLASATTISLSIGETKASIDAALEVGGSITGTVTAGSNGGPIAGVYVRAEAVATGYGSSFYGQTGGSGEFTIGGLPTGDYRVYFDAPDDSAWVSAYFGGGTFLTTPTVSVSVGKETPNIDAILVAGQSISGLVSNSAGDPLAGVQVYVRSDDGSLQRSVDTGEDGRYSVSGLPPGDYSVRFEADSQNYAAEYYDNQTVEQSATLVTVAGDAPVTGIDATLESGGAISGTIRNSTGQPISGVQVNAFSWTGSQQLAYAYSDSLGRYTISGLAAGSYRIEFFATGAYSAARYPTAVTVSAGQAVEGIDAVLTSGGTIAGRVTAAGSNTPLANAHVSVSLVGSNHSNGFQTDGNGYYEISGLVPGNYRVQFSGPPDTGYMSTFYNGKDYATADSVTVTAGGITANINAQLKTGAEIRGKVTAAGTSTPLAGVSVRAWATAGGSFGWGTTDAFGNYALRGLKPGSYKIEFDAPASLNRISSYYNGKTRETADLVTVTDGQSKRDVNIGLLAGAIISGKVTASDTGLPLKGVNVSAASTDGSIWESVSTDSLGRYTIGGLVSGTYTVRVDAPHNSKFASLYFGGATSAEAESIDLSAGGERSAVDVVLPVGASVSGRVVDSAGNGIGGISVNLFDSPNDESWQTAQTDASGRFTVSQLPANNYRILIGSVFEDSPAFARTWHGGTSFATASPIAVAEGDSVTGVTTVIPRVVTRSEIAAPVVTLQSETSNSFTVRWTKPAASGPILGYEVGYGFRGGEDWFVFGADSLSTTAPLAGELPTQITVRAVTTTSIGAVGFYNRPPVTAVAAPTIALTPSDSSITVRLTPPTVAGKQFTDWSVKLSDGQRESVWEQPASGTSVTFFGLKPNTVYRVHALASTSGEPSTYTKWATASATTAAAPGAALVPSGTPALNCSGAFDEECTFDSGTWPAGTTLHYEWRLVQFTGDGAYDYVVSRDARYTPQRIGPSGNMLYAKVYAIKAGFKTAVVTSGTVGLGAIRQTLTPTPTIAGVAAVGATLTAIPGAWDAGVSLRYEWLRNGVVIPGATAASYILGGADYGSEIRVRVTGLVQNWPFPSSNVSNVIPATKTSEPVSINQVSVFEQPPTPTVSGVFTVGQVLTANPGDWGADVNWGYQWLRDGAVIPNATSRTFPLTVADAGKSISVKVIGKRTGFVDAEVTSDPSPAVLAIFNSLPAVTVSAPPKVGAAISAVVAVPAGVTASYRWLRSGAAIIGATGKNYTPSADDLGKPLSVRVTFTRDGFADATKVSASTANVTIGTIVAPASFAVTGTATVGEQLTVALGTWSPEPTEFRYQWKRAGVNIPGATNPTYTLVPADLSRAITVTVTATRIGYSQLTRTSAPTPAIGPASFGLLPTVTIDGSLRVGQTLTAAVTDSSPIAQSTGYKWFRSGLAAAVGSARTYTLTAADLGKVITLEVTVSRAGFRAGTSRVSSDTSVAEGNQVATPTPVIVGTPGIGQRLTVVPGAWDVGTRLSYRWLVSGSESPVSVTNSYTVTAADEGKTMKVVVLSQKDGYIPAAAESDSVGPVRAQLVVSNTVSIPTAPRVGTRVTAQVGTLPDGVTAEYQWLRSGATIVGANESSYLPEVSDLGRPLSVRVTFSKAGFTPAVKVSTPSANVAAGQFAAPSIVQVTGTAAVGSVLSVTTTGDWVPAPTELKYQWKRSGVNIPGATAATYALSSADQGRGISVAVTAVRPGYLSLTRTSGATSAVAGLFTNTVAPNLPAEVRVGQRLTAQTGTWSPLPTQFGYRWILDENNVVSTTSSYVVSPEAYDRELRLEVTAKRTGSIDRAVTSAATTVAPPKAQTGEVCTIWGTFGDDSYIPGTDGDDVICGLGGDDTVYGGGGNDVIDGGLGADELFGEDGADVLYGAGGNDVLDGGADEDLASFFDNTSALNANLTTGAAASATSGTDSLAAIEMLVGGAGNDSLTGDDGVNSLNGAAGNDTIHGAGGDDMLVLSAGNDSFNGGGGIDTLSFSEDRSTSAINLSINLGLSASQSTGDGNDSFVGIENVFGGLGNDTLTGNGDANTLSGLGGNDTLTGGLGNDTLTGGLGNDTASFADSTSVTAIITADLDLGLAFGRGDDSLLEIENLTGGAGNDSLSGDDQLNLLAGGAGNDSLAGREGDDTLVGGAGNDIVTGGPGTDTASFADSTAAITVSLAVVTSQVTGAGTDTIAEMENLTGGTGNDVLTGDGSNNALTGGAGNDTLQGGLGNDTLTGGLGNDTASFVSSSGPIRADLSISVAQDTGSGTDELSAIENLAGGAGNDVLVGNGGPNVLIGGNGNDSLTGGAGNDSLLGGGGIDTVSFAGSSVPIAVNLASTSAQNTGAGTDTLSGNENVIGGSTNDTLTGDGAANTLIGGGGNDTLTAGGGNDTLRGGAGNDTLAGQAGNDTLSFEDATANLSVNLASTAAQNTGVGSDKLSGNENVAGGSGNDVLAGDTASNILIGGEGNDILQGGAGSDTLTGGSGNDRVDGGANADTLDGGQGVNTCVYTAEDTVQTNCDSVAPFFSGVSAPSSVDTSATSQAVAIGLTASDDLSGVESVFITLNGPGNQLVQNGNAALTDGDGISGRYQKTLTLPVNSAGGTWRIMAQLTDRAGNSRLVQLGSFEQTGPGDTEAPVSTNPVSTLSVDTSTGPKPVEVTLDVSDDISGVETVFVTLLGPAGQLIQNGSATRTSGDLVAGSYRIELLLPQFAQKGTWIVQAELVDAAGNSRQVQLGSVEQTGDSDNLAPEASLTRAPATVVTSGGAQQVDIELTARDDLAGVELAFVTLTGPGGQFLQNGGARLISGDAMNGTYLMQLTLPQFAATGTWTIHVEMVDTAGNRQQLTLGTIEVAAG